MKIESGEKEIPEEFKELAKNFAEHIMGVAELLIRSGAYMLLICKEFFITIF